jgi:ribose transport system substrate-binding protein
MNVSRSICGSRRARLGARALTSVVGVLACIVALSACGSGSSGSGSSSGGGGGGDRYSAMLLNPFMGNDWRPQMEKYAQVVAKKAPLSSSVSSMRVVTTQDNDVSQQSAALRSAILAKPDVIIIDSASTTGLNGLIQQACAKNITVVSFDVLASAPCAWKLSANWVSVGRAWADWMAKSVGGQGLILVDKGTAGTQSSDDITKGINEVLAKYPKIKPLTYYGKMDPGAETTAVTQLLAAHRDVRGILSQGYGAQEAQAKYKLKLPATGNTFPPTMSGCVDRNVPCFLIGVPAWLSADALRLAVQVKQGKVKGNARFVSFPIPRFLNNTKITPPSTDLGGVYSLATELKNAPKDATLPVSPPWVKVDFEKEILGR